jgi:hypothetical protein
VFLPGLVLAHESHLTLFRPFLSGSFGFLNDGALRGLFYLFLAALASDMGVLGWISAVTLISCGALNCYILYAFPQYHAVREEVIREEDAQIQREVKRLAAAGVYETAAREAGWGRVGAEAEIGEASRGGRSKNATHASG